MEESFRIETGRLGGYGIDRGAAGGDNGRTVSSGIVLFGGLVFSNLRVFLMAFYGPRRGGWVVGS